MQATTNFTATLDGVRYSLEKGQTFTGDKRAARYLKSLGLIATATKTSTKKKKGQEDER